MLIRHRLDAQLIQQLGRIRKDQLPNQKIIVFDSRDSVIFCTNERLFVTHIQIRISRYSTEPAKRFSTEWVLCIGIRS